MSAYLMQMGPLLDLSVSVAVVFAASVLFVNAIEYQAERFRWSSSFTGAIVTPLFTSIPELFIFLLAITVYSNKSGHEIGLGTIFGEPFMTSTLSYFLVLVSLLAALLTGRHVSKTFKVGREMQLPYVFIAILLPWLIIPGVIHSSYLQYMMGIIYLALYLVYILLMHRTNVGAHHEEIETPYFVRLIHKPAASFLQIGTAAVLLYFGSTLLIESISVLSRGSSGTALSVSIILIPVATAIPETIAGMIWAFRGKNTLAIGSLVGENVLYATFYPGIALLLIPWSINLSATISIAGTALTSLMYFMFVRRGSMPVYMLSMGFIVYIAFLLSIYH